jgi:c-di-GMP-binding flagellar brake protein YcgR
VTTPATPIARKGAPKPSDAVAPIASNGEAFEMHDPFDIGEALELLARSGEPVSVYPDGAKDKEALMARIDSVHPDQPTFVIDFAGATPPAGAATLVASLGGNAKLQFELTQDWRSLPGEPHLVPAEFSPYCLVLNRRAAARLETSVGVPFTASFNFHGKSHELPLNDFSINGVGLRASPYEAFGLSVGKEVIDVRLELGPELVLTVDLEIRLVRPFKTMLLGNQVQLGCRFTSISKEMRQALERFITKTNRLRNGA